MPITYGHIAVKQHTKNVFTATTKVTSPGKFTIEMTGHTAEVAEKKLILFLENKPYKHLDNVSK